MPPPPEIKAWAESLETLLSDAARAARSKDPTRIVAAQKALRNFKNESPDYADVLDTQASLAIFDLDLQETEDAVDGIKERAAEVGRIGKLIGGITEEASANLSILDGSLAQNAIEAATATINSFKMLRDELAKSKPQSDEKAIADQIDALLKSIQAVRNRLEST